MAFSQQGEYRRENHFQRSPSATATRRPARDVIVSTITRMKPSTKVVARMAEFELRLCSFEHIGQSVGRQKLHGDGHSRARESGVAHVLENSFDALALNGVGEIEAIGAGQYVRPLQRHLQPPNRERPALVDRLGRHAPRDGFTMRAVVPNISGTGRGVERLNDGCCDT